MLPALSVFFDTTSNLHPYGCDGPGRCLHCDRKTTWRGEGGLRHHPLDTIEDATWVVEHDPETCALCRGET